MTEPVDVLLIGGGVMSATLGTFISQLEPDWTIEVYERLGDVALESSNAWNNAGTGHAALCELNYMPAAADGSVDPAKAISINEQFQLSRQFWASLVERGILDEPSTFINSTPHMTFVRGEKDVAYLKRRYEALKTQPLFAGIEYSEDSRVINQWAPLLMQKRLASDEPFAATRVPAGTDVDFGALTRQLFDNLKQHGGRVVTDRQVTGLKKLKDGTWEVSWRNQVGRTPGKTRARFVFVGAGGWAIKLLQKSGIPEIKGYGVFPIGGQWLKTSNPGNWHHGKHVLGGSVRKHARSCGREHNGRERGARGKASGADVGSAYDVPTLSPKPKSPMAHVRAAAEASKYPARAKVCSNQNAPRGLGTLAQDTLAHNKGEGHAARGYRTTKPGGSAPRA